MGVDRPLVWDAPVTHLSDARGWAFELTPYWTWVLTIMAPVREDAIGAAEWKHAEAYLNSLHSPVDLDLVNSVWREFLARVWCSRLDWEARMRTRRALGRGRAT